MWTVHKIEQCTFLSKEPETPSFFHVSPYSLIDMEFAVTIMDMSTGRLLRQKSNTIGVDMINFLRKYNPYGFIDNNPGTMSIDNPDGLVVIDKLSWDMLSFADSVEQIDLYESDRAYQSLKNLTGKVYSVDKTSSILAVKPLNGQICLGTLMQLMCLYPDGWVGNNFYFYSDYCYDSSIKVGSRIGFRLLKVAFNDVGAARALHTKALLCGYSPLAKYFRI